MKMASVAAISTMLQSPPRVHSVAPPLQNSVHAHTLPFLRRRPRSLTMPCAAVQTQRQGAAVPAQRQGAAVPGAGIRQWTHVPVFDINPATEDESIFLITLDLSSAPHLVDAYTTPGQYLLTRVPSGEKRPPAYMCISSAPRSGPRFDLLVRSVPGTTSEKLCKLNVGDVVELGPVTGPGFDIQRISPPAAAETMFLFAVGEGISPIRALIEYGFAASARADVRLYYITRDPKSMPYQERFEKWEETGVHVVPLPQQIHPESFLKGKLIDTKLNPLSTGAVIVSPLLLKEVLTGVLLDHGVPHDKILTIEWCPEDPFAPNV